MSTRPAAKRQSERDGEQRRQDERRAEERAQEIVERASEQVTRFGRRLFARAREEIEDIVAEAQTIRRGGPPRG